MSVAKLSKLFIISHKTDTEAVLKKLQKTPLAIEVRPYTHKIEVEIPVSETGPEYTTRVKKAMGVLNNLKMRN